MSNIVEFPPSDRPIDTHEPEHQWTESEVDKIHAEAFRDLEGSISDCVWMSVIALEMVERAIEGRDDKHEKAMFAVFESAKRLMQLKTNYYAAWHGEKLGGAS
jgi:hypothetical protein